MSSAILPWAINFCRQPGTSCGFQSQSLPAVELIAGRLLPLILLPRASQRIESELPASRWSSCSSLALLLKNCGIEAMLRNRNRRLPLSLPPEELPQRRLAIQLGLGVGYVGRHFESISLPGCNCRFSPGLSVTPERWLLASSMREKS
jgi:hypothetical protein